MYLCNSINESAHCKKWVQHLNSISRVRTLPKSAIGKKSWQFRNDWLSMLKRIDVSLWACKTFIQLFIEFTFILFRFTEFSLVEGQWSSPLRQSNAPPPPCSQSSRTAEVDGGKPLAQRQMAQAAICVLGKSIFEGKGFLSSEQRTTSSTLYFSINRMACQLPFPSQNPNKCINDRASKATTAARSVN